MNFRTRSFTFLVTFFVTSLCASAVAQTNLIAPVTGSVTGTVENEFGEMVAPEAAVSATVVAVENEGVITANVSGTASCSGGLGLHFTFEAQYDASTNSFTGMYSDTPGSTPDQSLTFVNDGGLQWTALLSGQAPSDNGARAYDLSVQFVVPDTAIFVGESLPAEQTYGGSLETTTSVSVPVSVPLAGIDQTLDFSVTLTGSWNAVAVPQPDSSVAFTGEASGSFSSNASAVTGTVPGLGDISVPIQIGGSFGGSLFMIDDDTVAFQGSWVASGGEQTFGGDLSITIEFQDTSSFPFTISGVVPVATGISQMPTLNVPFSVSGAFPLSLQ